MESFGLQSMDIELRGNYTLMPRYVQPASAPLSRWGLFEM